MDAFPTRACSKVVMLFRPKIRISTPVGFHQQAMHSRPDSKSLQYNNMTIRKESILRQSEYMEGILRFPLSEASTAVVYLHR